MIEYVIKLDSMSGGSSDGAKLTSGNGGKVLEGEIIPLARGASIRKMDQISSIIWGEYSEAIDSMPLDKAKWFISQRLAAMISEAYANGSSYDLVGSLIKQRDYVENFSRR